MSIIKPEREQSFYDFHSKGRILKEVLKEIQIEVEKDFDDINPAMDNHSRRLAVKINHITEYIDDIDKVIDKLTKDISYLDFMRRDEGGSL